ncbi:MAG: MerR family transcriptional regulator [Bdellovibrio sp.]
MTTTITSEPDIIEMDSSELSLGDQHLHLEEEDNKTEVLVVTEMTDTTDTTVVFSPVSLPAMLCDDKLLEEISAIPKKMGFKIGEVADILGIKQYVLRYWETEFELLRPKKASNNQRMYTRKDVENALLIRKLLHRDRFSIEGARNALKELKAHVRKEKDMSHVINKLDSISEAVEDLILDIRRVRSLFK